MNIYIKEVKAKPDLKTFIHLPEKLHAGHKEWTHPIYRDEWEYFDRNRNKAFSYCDTILLFGLP
jgi:hypothetical protein